MPRFLDNDNGAVLQIPPGVSENLSESINDGGACRVVQSNQDDPDPLTSSVGGHLAEVQIEGDHNPALRGGKLEYSTV